MHPKHDLSGGEASADSFVISSSDLVASMKRCFLAAEFHEFARYGDNLISYVNLASWRSFPGRPEIVEGRLRGVGIRWRPRCLGGTYTREDTLESPRHCHHLITGGEPSHSAVRLQNHEISDIEPALVIAKGTAYTLKRPMRWAGRSLSDPRRERLNS